MVRRQSSLELEDSCIKLVTKHYPTVTERKQKDCNKLKLESGQLK